MSSLKEEVEHSGGIKKLIIRIRDERFSPLQALLILSLRSGDRRLNELLKILKGRGLKSRSSFYTAVYELERRGIIVREGLGRDFKVKLTEKGDLIARELPSKLREQLYPMLNVIYSLLAVLGGELKLEEDVEEEPTTLIEYREFLSREMERVDREIKKWKKIRVE